MSANDADLPSLSSFTVDDKRAALGSFIFLPSLRFASCCCCIPLRIDFPSLRAIRLGRWAFCAVSHAEFASIEAEMI